MNRHAVRVAGAALAGVAVLMSSQTGAGALTGSAEAAGSAVGVAVSGAVGARLSSVSCVSAGNCAAGGAYFTSSGQSQALVVSEVHGVWGQGVQVPGIGALNAAGAAAVTSVSCASAGNCSAGGYYTGNAHAPSDQQAFVVSEVNGVWGQAQPVPGLAALNTGNTAQLTSVSCVSAGPCGAAGYYTDRAGIDQAFVVSQAGGTWGKAEEIHGPAAPIRPPGVWPGLGWPR